MARRTPNDLSPQLRQMIRQIDGTVAQAQRITYEVLELYHRTEQKLAEECAGESLKTYIQPVTQMWFTSDYTAKAYRKHTRIAPRLRSIEAKWDMDRELLLDTFDLSAVQSVSFITQLDRLATIAKFPHAFPLLEKASKDRRGRLDNRPGVSRQDWSPQDIAQALSELKRERNTTSDLLPTPAISESDKIGSSASSHAKDPLGNSIADSVLDAPPSPEIEIIQDLLLDEDQNIDYLDGIQSDDSNSADEIPLDICRVSSEDRNFNTATKQLQANAVSSSRALKALPSHVQRPAKRRKINCKIPQSDSETSSSSTSPDIEIGRGRVFESQPREDSMIWANGDTTPSKLFSMNGSIELSITTPAPINVEKLQPRANDAESFECLRYAIASLEDGVKVNDVAINRLFSRLQSKEIGVVDSLTLKHYIGCADFGSEILPARIIKLRTCSLILLPYFSESCDHWSLFLYDTRSGDLEYYDPLFSEVRKQIAGKSLVPILRWVFERSVTLVGATRIMCPQQTNNVDCGVYIVAIAQTLASQRDLSCSLDYHRLRRELVALLLTSANAVPNVVTETFAHSSRYLLFDTRQPLHSAPWSSSLNKLSVWHTAYSAHWAIVYQLGSLLSTMHAQHLNYLRQMGSIEADSQLHAKGPSILQAFTNEKAAITARLDLAFADICSDSVTDDSLRNIQQYTIDSYNVMFDALRARSLQANDFRRQRDNAAGRIKGCIVLCEVFGPRYRAALQKMNRMQKMENSFLAMAEACLS